MTDQTREPPVDPRGDPRGTEDTVLSRSAQMTPAMAGLDERLERGAALGRYVVLQFIASGGMGAVYAAYDPQLDRRVAVKLIRSGRDGQVSDRARARLQLEAQALARLAHPNVVAVHDVDEADGRLFVAMEFVEGDDLTAWMRQPRRPAEVLEVFLAAARGLAAAHGAGLVHRDFKPQNVLVGRDGRVRVADFGIARRDGEAPEAVDISGLPSHIARARPDVRTGTGLMGTPAYMAPEQVVGGPVDARADQFAWCVALYEALYGQRPFEREVLATPGVAQKVLKPKAPGATPSWVLPVLERGLSWKAEDRFPSMQAVIDALRPPPARSKRGLLLAVGLTVAAAVGGGTVKGRANRQQRCEDLVAAKRALWAPERKAQLEQVFLATRAPRADEKFAAVARTFEAWLSGWAASARDSCLATEVLGVQSAEAYALRSECLDGELSEASALLEQLATADAKVVAKAPEAVRGLRRVSVCDDLPSLAKQASAVDPERRRAVKRDLRTAVALARLGRNAEAISALTTLMPAAGALGDLPLEGEAHYTLGLALASVGKDLPGARQQQHLAAIAAERANDADLKARAWAALSTVEGPLAGNLEEGQRYAQYALAAASHVSAPDVAGLIHSGLAEQAQARGDWANALVEAKAAVDTLSQVNTDEDEVLAAALNNQALALSKLNRRPEALALFERTLAACERVAPGSLRCAVTQMNIANQLRRLGRLDEAAAAHRKVIAVREQQSPDSPDLGASYSNLADVLQEQNKPDEAQALYERAFAVLEKTLGPSHPNVAIVSLNLCGLLHEKSQWAAALTHCARALSIMHAKAPTHPLIADIYTLEAECELGRDDLKAAEQLLAKSLAQCDGEACKPQFEAARLTVQARLVWATTHDRAKTMALVRRAREGFSAGSAHDSAQLNAWVAKEKLE